MQQRISRRNLFRGAASTAAGAAAAALPVPQAPAAPRVVLVHRQPVVHRAVIDGNEESIGGSFSRSIRAEQAQSAAKAMVILAEKLSESHARENALWAVIRTYVERFGPLPEARAAFYRIADAYREELEAEANG